MMLKVDLGVPGAGGGIQRERQQGLLEAEAPSAGWGEGGRGRKRN